MDFKNVDKKYRPVPFWSWNEKLNVPESVRQTALMDEAGIGGYFMHARGGLQTEYMGKEWFENVAACVEECKKRGMHAWAYDENGWPSGFGGGKVNGKGEKYWQKYLRVRSCADNLSDIPENRIIYNDGKKCFYYEVNPFYVDTMDREVIGDFIKEIYVPYYEKFGSGFEGFFTDEPQISRNGIPWSLTLPQKYKEKYGEDINGILESLFEQTGDFKTARVKFWKLVTELFSENFMKQIHDWCKAHDLKFTGHLVLEESLHSQLVSNGACMPHYEYLDIPGMDWLCRPIFPCLTPLQVASTAAQTGKKQVLSETFALCGHNVGHDELKRNYEWMTVRGINLMCQHLEGYSLRGIRKRDYPPAMYVQQPWWADYKIFNDAMSRVGMMLCEGRIEFDTLLMHNMTSAWICYNDKDNKGLDELNSALIEDINKLEAKHIPFHLGDEILMERHGRVEGGKLVIGEMAYSRVVIPKHIMFLENTEKLLAEFRAAGGIVTTADEVEANGIIDNPEITYTCREYDGFTLHYFVNSTDRRQKAKIAKGSYAIDIVTGEKTDFYGEYTFPEYGSLVVIDDGSEHAKMPAIRDLKSLDITGDWIVENATENSLTLDKCTYWFDGELQQENGYILNVASRAYALERPVDIRCRFIVNMEYVPEKLYLACETPEIFDITINGKKLDKKDCGYFRDISFRKLDVSGYFGVGENVIETFVHFSQSDEVYENMKKSKIFESEKNKLTYDMEIESMYLVGDFGVRCDGKFEEIPNDASFFDGSFTVVAPVHAVSLHEIEKQGYPFFCGELTLSKTFELEDGEYRFDSIKKGVNVIRVSANGKECGKLLWAPYEVDLSDVLIPGKNTVKITLVNNLRNLLGPHHHVGGEIFAVSPASFYDEGCIWNGYSGGYYTDKYSFVHTSLI